MDKISKERLQEMVGGFSGLTPADCADSSEIDSIVPELIALRTAAEGMEKALAAIICGECPIVTHHRPDCEWCAGLKALADYRKVKNG